MDNSTDVQKCAIKILKIIKIRYFTFILFYFTAIFQLNVFSMCAWCKYLFFQNDSTNGKVKCINVSATMHQVLKGKENIMTHTVIVVFFYICYEPC